MKTTEQLYDELLKIAEAHSMSQAFQGDMRTQAWKMLEKHGAASEYVWLLSPQHSLLIPLSQMSTLSTYELVTVVSAFETVFMPEDGVFYAIKQGEFTQITKFDAVKYLLLANMDELPTSHVETLDNK